MDCIEKLAKGPDRFTRSTHCYQGFSVLLGISMETKEFQNIKKDLRSLREAYMNPIYSPMDQIANLRLIGSELTKRHPQVFEGEHGHKHLLYAIRIIMHQHGTVRSAIRCAKKKKVEVKDNFLKSLRLCDVEGSIFDNIGPTVMRNIGHPKALTPPKKILNRRFFTYVLVPTPRKMMKVSTDQPLFMPVETAPIIDCTDNRNLSNVRHNVDIPVDSNSAMALPNSNAILEPIQHYLRPFNDIPAPAAPYPGPRQLELPPLYTNSILGLYSEAQSYPSAQANLNSETFPSTEVPSAIRQTEIYTFLSTCQPPMMHYLRRFVDFGCITSTHLRSVSLWRVDQRYTLLRKILTSGEHDGVPAEMDIAILENQFGTYFLED